MVAPRPSQTAQGREHFGRFVGQPGLAEQRCPVLREMEQRLQRGRRLRTADQVEGHDTELGRELHVLAQSGREDRHAGIRQARTRVLNGGPQVVAIGVAQAGDDRIRARLRILQKEQNRLTPHARILVVEESAGGMRLAEAACLAEQGQHVAQDEPAGIAQTRFDERTDVRAEAGKSLEQQPARIPRTGLHQRFQQGLGSGDTHAGDQDIENVPVERILGEHGRERCGSRDAAGDRSGGSTVRCASDRIEQLADAALVDHLRHGMQDQVTLRSRFQRDVHDAVGLGRNATRRVPGRRTVARAGMKALSHQAADTARRHDLDLAADHTAQKRLGSGTIGCRRGHGRPRRFRQQLPHRWRKWPLVCCGRRENQPQQRRYGKQRRRIRQERGARGKVRFGTERGRERGRLDQQNEIGDSPQCAGRRVQIVCGLGDDAVDRTTDGKSHVSRVRHNQDAFGEIPRTDRWIRALCGHGEILPQPVGAAAGGRMIP
jgi:hypothetical protein